jgi:hypothetical protein
MTEFVSNTDRICPKHTGSILNYESIQYNFFGPNIVISFLVEVVMVIVNNVNNASASTEATAATIANYPLLLYIPCPQDLLPS